VDACRKEMRSSTILCFMISESLSEDTRTALYGTGVGSEEGCQFFESVFKNLHSTRKSDLVCNWPNAELLQTCRADKSLRGVMPCLIRKPVRLISVAKGCRKQWRDAHARCRDTGPGYSRLPDRPVLGLEYFRLHEPRRAVALSQYSLGGGTFFAEPLPRRSRWPPPRPCFLEPWELSRRATQFSEPVEA
jgi:hypothetical protein